MKKEDLPQDKGAITDLCYVVDESGNYSTEVSKGWEVKMDALGVAWEDINEKVKEAQEMMEAGEVSPVKYFMELKIMDVGLVASYTGFWQWQVKRHMKPKIFRKLNNKKLSKYAEVFEVSLEELVKLGKNEG